MTTLYFSKNASIKNMLQRLHEPDTLAVINKMELLERKLKTAEISKRGADASARSRVEREINALEFEHKQELEKHAANSELANVRLPEAEKKIEKFVGREKAFMDQVGWLMDRTRRESKRSVLERCVLCSEWIVFAFFFLM